MVRILDPESLHRCDMSALELRGRSVPLRRVTEGALPLNVAVNVTGETFNNSKLVGVRDAREVNLRGLSGRRRLFR